MKAMKITALLPLLFCIALQAQPAQKAAAASDRDRLIGAWHLASIESPGPDRKATPNTSIQGMLIYTRDGHLSVQLMYPASAHAPDNEYVRDGYEASFGSFSIDAKTHTLTHHILGSNTRDLLLGKDLPRIYELTADGRLIIHSANPAEHWRVTWEHY